MLRARIRPGRGANCWRRFFASSSSIGGGEKGSLAANLNNNNNNNTADDDLVRRRALTLSLWRDYLCLLERLGPEDAAKRKASAAAEIRSWSEEQKKGQQKSDGDEEKQPPLDPDAGVKRLMAAVSFLRATTRRSAGDRRRLSSSGEGVFVVREGELVRVEGGGGERGGGELSSRSTQAGKLSPDEAFRKHRELMRRQFYGREPPRGAPGRF